MNINLGYTPFSIHIGSPQSPYIHGIISGGTGSGKTLLAQHIAKQFVSGLNRGTSNSGAQVIVGAYSTTDNWNDNYTLYKGLGKCEGSLNSFVTDIENLVHSRLEFVRRGEKLDISPDAVMGLLSPVLIIVDGIDWNSPEPEGKENLEKIVSLMKISRQAGVFFLVTTQSPVGLSQLTNQMSYSISLDENSAMYLGGGGDIEFEGGHEVKQAAFKSWNLLEPFVFSLPQLPHPAG